MLTWGATRKHGDEPANFSTSFTVHVNRSNHTALVVRWLAAVLAACHHASACVHACGASPCHALSTHGNVPVPQWRIEGFGKLPSEGVYSDSFEAGIGPWRLRLDPQGCGDVKGTHLSVFLELQDAMWAPGSLTYKLTAGLHAFTSNICIDTAAWGSSKFIKLSALRDAAAGWLVNDTLVLSADVTVEHEDRLELGKGGSPGDVTLKLPCGAEVYVSSHILQMASPFFHQAVEDIDGSDPIPILSNLDPQYDPPALTLGSVFTLLPVAHKYDFDKLLKQLLAVINETSGALSHNPVAEPGDRLTYIIPLLALAERLQLDEPVELCLDRLRTMNREQLQMAITVVAVEVGSGTSEKLLLSLRNKHVMRVEVEQLSEALREKLLAITSLLPN
ncbi:hypothetical protein FOA52_001869 [Chlamydomonas sp. UWO 241]|nr:hypothetical protein FOA52_001869 [Chlamydomonas sp. UWO 241]